MPRIKEISVADLYRMLREHDHFELLDIRTRAEIARGVLPDARTLPMHLVPLNLNFFSESGKQIVVYCRTGSRSSQVCRFLHQQGIYNVISLRGGLVKWAASGYPIDPRPRDAIG
jgi:rhodanese-related sulfurtransferase